MQGHPGGQPVRGPVNGSADPSSTLQMLVDAAEAAVFSGQRAKVVELGEQTDSLPATNPPRTGCPVSP